MRELCRRLWPTCFWTSLGFSGWEDQGLLWPKHRPQSACCRKGLAPPMKLGQLGLPWKKNRHSKINTKRETQKIQHVRQNIGGNLGGKLRFKSALSE